MLPGDYKVIAERPGFERWTGRVTVENGKTAKLGVTLAELVATGKTPDLIAPFAMERFHTDTLVSELAAAAVSH